MRMTTRLMMTAVAVTVTRTLERVALLRDRAAAVVIRYTITPKTMENVRAICVGKTRRDTHQQAITEHLQCAECTAGYCYWQIQSRILSCAARGI